MPRNLTKKKTEKESEAVVPVTIRFPAEIHKQGAALADADERSFNTWVVRACIEALKAPPRRAAAR